MKFTQWASTAPGSPSVGTMRPVIASTVFHSWLERVSGSLEAAAAARARGRGIWNATTRPAP